MLSIPTLTGPLVSVIVPCYRQTAFLREAIDSVLGQTYANTEVIVVNDGSDDDTETVARSYGNRVRYVYRENGGLSAARNTGLSHAAGDYVVFLDADDWLLPEMVASLLAVAGSQDECAVACEARLVAQDGHDLRWMRESDRQWQAEHRSVTSVAEQFKTYNPLPVHTVLISRASVVAAGGFDESLNACEDWDLWRETSSSSRSRVCNHDPGELPYAGRVGSILTSPAGVAVDAMLSRTCVALGAWSGNLELIT